MILQLFIKNCLNVLGEKSFTSDVDNFLGNNINDREEEPDFVEKKDLLPSSASSSAFSRAFHFGHSNLSDSEFNEIRVDAIDAANDFQESAAESRNHETREVPLRSGSLQGRNLDDYRKRHSSARKPISLGRDSSDYSDSNNEYSLDYENDENPLDKSYRRRDESEPKKFHDLNDSPEEQQNRKLSNMLSFKAHLHHNTEDIGKAFLPKKHNKLDNLLNLPESQDYWNVLDKSPVARKCTNDVSNCNNLLYSDDLDDSTTNSISENSDEKNMFDPDETLLDYNQVPDNKYLDRAQFKKKADNLGTNYLNNNLHLGDSHSDNNDNLNIDDSVHDNNEADNTFTSVYSNEDNLLNNNNDNYQPDAINNYSNDFTSSSKTSSMLSSEEYSANDKNRDSLSTVIEPLSKQLQKLLFTLKRVNRNLIKAKRRMDESILNAEDDGESSRMKRFYPSSELFIKNQTRSHNCTRNKSSDENKNFTDSQPSNDLKNKKPALLTELLDNEIESLNDDKSLNVSNDVNLDASYKEGIDKGSTSGSMDVEEPLIEVRILLDNLGHIVNITNINYNNGRERYNSFNRTLTYYVSAEPTTSNKVDNPTSKNSFFSMIANMFRKKESNSTTTVSPQTTNIITSMENDINDKSNLEDYDDKSHFIYTTINYDYYTNQEMQLNSSNSNKSEENSTKDHSTEVDYSNYFETRVYTQSTQPKDSYTINENTNNFETNNQEVSKQLSSSTEYSNITTIGQSNWTCNNALNSKETNDTVIVNNVFNNNFEAAIAETTQENPKEYFSNNNTVTTTPRVKTMCKKKFTLPNIHPVQAYLVPSYYSENYKVGEVKAKKYKHLDSKLIKDQSDDCSENRPNYNYHEKNKRETRRKRGKRKRQPYKDLKKLDWYRAAGLDPANKKLMAQFESDLNRKSRKRRDASDIGTQMNSYFEALRLLNQSSGESEDYNSEPQTADTPEWLLWGLNYPEPTAEMIIDTSSVAISTSELTSVAEEAPFDEEVSEIISSTTVEEETEGPMYTTVGKGAMETEINTVEIISKEESPSSSETNIFEATSAEIATTDGNQSAMIFQSSTNLINSMNEGTLKITVETITQDPLMMRTGSTGISLNTEIETSSTKISSSLSTIEGAEEASINDVQSSKYETEGYTAVETTSNEEFLETTKEQFKSTEKLEEITSVLTSRIEKEENEETESLLVTTEAEFTETSLTTEMETLKTKISSTFSTIEDTEETLITVTPLPKEKTKVYASVETTTNEEFIRRTQGQFKSTEKLEEVTSVLTSRIEKEEETKVTTEIPPTSESPLTVRTESTRISLNTKVEMPTTKISSSLSTIGITEKTSITDIQSPQQETEAYTTIEKTINEEFTKTNEPLKSTEKFEEVTSEFTSRMEEESDITTETPATTENPVTTAAESSIISLITEVETSTTKISSSLSTIGETETYTTVKTIESEESTKTNEPLRITEKLEEITTMFTGKTEEEIEITTEIPATTESPTTARTESSVVSLITEVQTSTTKISSSLSTVESTDETSAQEREGYTTLETTGNEEIIRTKEQVKSTEELEEVTSVLTSRMEEESEITTEISATTEGLLTTRLESTPISISTEVKTPTAKISLSLSTVESTEETETYTAVKTIGNEEIIKTTKEEFKSTEKLEQVTSVLTSRMEEESEITTEIPAATEGLLTTKSEPTPMSFSIEVETPTTKISSSLSTVESTEETSITISQLPKEETETYTAVETTSNEEIIRTTKERLKSTEKLEQVTSVLTSRMEEESEITTEIPAATEGQLTTKAESSPMSFSIEVETPTTKISSSLSTVENIQETSITISQLSKEETESYSSVEITMSEESVRSTKKPFKSTEKLEEVSSVLTSRMEKEENEITTEILPTSVSLITSETESTEKSLSTELEISTTKIFSSVSTIEGTGETLITDMQSSKQETEASTTTETTTTEEFVRTSKEPLKSTEKFEEITSVLTSKMEEEESKMTIEIPPTSESPLTVRTESTRISFNTKVEMPTTKISSSPSTIGNTEKTSIINIQSPQQETEAYTTIEKTINEEFTKTNEPLRSTEKFEKVTSAFTGRMEEESDITTETAVTTESPVTTTTEFSIISSISEMETSTTKISSSLSTILDTEETTITDTQTSQQETESYTTVEKTINEKLIKTNEPLRSTEKLEKVTVVFTSRMEEESEITTEIPATTGTESALVSLITEVETSMTKISSSLSTVESTEKTSITDVQSSKEETETFSSIEIATSEESLRSTKELIKSTEELEGVTSVLTSKMEKEESGGSTEKLYSTAYDTSTEKFFQTLEISSIPIENILEKSTTEDLDKKLTKTISLSTSTETERISESTSMEFTESITKSLIFTTVPMTVEESTFTPVTNIISLETLSTNAASLSRSAATVSPEESTLEWSTITTDEVETKETTSSEMKTKGTIYTIGEKTEPITQKNVEYDEEHEYDYTTIEIIRTTGTPIPLESTPFLDEMETEDEESERKSILVLKTNLPISIATKARHFFGLEKTTEKIEIKKLTPWQIVDTSTTDISEISSTTEIVDEISTTSKAKEKSTESTTETAEETTIMKSTAETTEETAIRSTTEAIEETTVRSTTETEEDTTVGGTTETEEETTVGSTTETEKETTMKSTTEIAKETTIKSTTETEKETTIKSTTENAKETTIKSTTENAEETTIKSTTEAVEETTIKSTTEAIEETTLRSTTETEEDTTVGGTTETEEETTVESTTETEKETTMKSTTEIAKETTIKSTTKIAEETTMKSTAEAIEETTVRSTTEIEEETTVRSTTETEEETTVKSTTEIAEETTVASTSETEKETTIKSTSGTIVETVTVSKVEETTTKSTTIKKITTETPSIKSIHLTERLTTIEAGTDDYKDFSREDTSLVVETTRKHKEEKYLTTKSSEIEKTLEDEEEYPEEEDTTDTFEYYYEAESTTKGPKWESFPSYSTTVLPRLDYDDVVNPDVLEITKPPTKLLLEVTMPSISTSVESFSDFSSPDFTVPVRDFTEESSVLAITEGETTLKVFEKIDLVTDKKDTLDVDSSLLELGLTTASMVSKEEEKELDKKLTSTDISFTLTEKENETPLIDLDFSTKIFKEETHSTIGNLEFTTALPSVEGEEKGVVVSTGSSFTSIDKETESPLTVLDLSISTIFNVEETKNTMINVESTTSSSLVEKEESKELQEPLTSKGPSFTLVIKEIETPLTELELSTNTVFKVEETTNAVVNIEFTTSSLSGGEKGKELEEKIISTDSSLTLADKESESPLIELDLSAKTTFNLEEIKNIMVNVEFTTPLPSVEDEEKGIVISTGSSFTLIDKETESSLTVLELNTSTIFEAQETEKTMKNVEFTTPSLSVEEEGKELQETTASTGPSFTLVIKEIETPLANLDSTTNTVVNIESTISLSSVEEEQAKELEEKIISTSSSLTLVEETNETPLTELDLSARTTFNLEEIRNLMVNVEFTSPLSLEQEGNVTSTGSSFTLVDKESDTSLTELNLSAKTTFNLEETKNTMENIKSTTPLLLVEKEETWDELESTTSVTTEESFTSREQEETSIITTESIKDKSEQKKKMEHLEERLKELEMLEKKMFQREQTHDEDVERWRQSKKERKQQLKDEILAKKQSTTIPTTEIDTITVSTPEDDLDTEIKRLEEEIGEKERELEERERRLHEREENFQKEREEFESELLKKESEQEKEKETTETKTMEGETTKTEIKEIKTFHESTPIPVTTTVKPSVSMSTQLPPVEETVSTTKWETTVVTTVLSVDHDDDDYIEGGTTENERKGQVAPKNQQGDKRGEYEYDQEEEIWKKQHPDHESINEDEPVTVKVCLNVLKNHSKILNGTVSSKKVCLPIISSDINEDIRHSDSVSRRLSRDVLPFFKNPSVTEITKLKRDDKNVKRIDSLDLQHEEWLENNATKPLQVFQGFTRVYEKWTEIPLEKYTIFHSITESDNLPQNKSFKVNQWRVDQNEKRIHPTKVDRLENFEWIEMTTNAMGVPHQNSHKLDEIGVEKRPRKRNLNYSRGKINDNYGHNKKSVADVAVDEFPPDYSENCNHDSNKKLNITLQPPLESETEDYRDIVRVETLDNEENDEVDDDKDCKNRKDKNELNEIDDDKIDNEKFEEKEENADADANDDDDDYDYEERDTKQIESELTDAKTEETFKDKGKSAENVKLSKANVSEGKIEEKIGLGTKENEDHEEIEYISDGTVDYKDNYNENYDDENVDTDYIDYKSDEMKPESKSMVQRPSMIKNHRSSSLEKNLERDKELMLLKREMDKINERKRKVLEEEKMLVKEEGFLNERKKLEQNDMDKKRNDRMIENTYRKSRSLLESNTENEGKGWPTENTLHYQIGGIETWVTSPPKKNDIVGKMRKSFTVNVLQLEYDEDEENHKLKSSNPDSEELIVKESTLRFNNCDRNKENPKLLNDKNENLLDVVEDGNSEEEELFEGITESKEYTDSIVL
ncbi:serine-rich adhesin for platelets-like [Prorops nasuta]|uniref:serine-rich adhesin for platelets-like n=1 Tax=Prorops nasuta TaxID=863751 RepID=UPI0034CDA651